MLNSLRTQIESWTKFWKERIEPASFDSVPISQRITGFSQAFSVGWQGSLTAFSGQLHLGISVFDRFRSGSLNFAVTGGKSQPSFVQTAR
jgi:hypothetical protein